MANAIRQVVRSATHLFPIVLAGRVVQIVVEDLAPFVVDDQNVGIVRSVHLHCTNQLWKLVGLDLNVLWIFVLPAATRLLVYCISRGSGRHAYKAQADHDRITDGVREAKESRLPG
jgi:hypothetical protein